MAARISVTVLPKGPFFERDPEKTFGQNVEAMMEGIAREGEAELKAVLRSGEGSRQPLSVGRLGKGSQGPALRVSSFVRGRVAGNVPWHRWAAISPYDPENPARTAVAVFAASSVLQRRTHAFSTVASRLRRSRAAQSAELLRGIE